ESDGPADGPDRRAAEPRRSGAEHDRRGRERGGGRSDAVPADDRGGVEVPDGREHDPRRGAEHHSVTRRATPVDLRVTGLMQANRTIAQLRASAARQANVQQQIASGIRVSQPSDDPAAYLEARRADALSGQIDTYLTTTATATNDLNSSVSTLQDATQLLT